MKRFSRIVACLMGQRVLFWWSLAVLAMPNLLLSITEPMGWVARVANLILPTGCYYLILSSSRNCGRTVWMMFPIVFLAAFQVVLLHLYGRSPIAVDMFLNLVTTNASEAMELLDNMMMAIVVVSVLYLPMLVSATMGIVRHRRLSSEFAGRNRRRAYIVVAVGCMMLVVGYATDDSYAVEKDLFPVNVGYNMWLAYERTNLQDSYHDDSRGFCYHAGFDNDSEHRQLCVLVVGETSRAVNWELYGYNRPTNPRLKHCEGVVVFDKVMSESNTTHKSVPMLLSSVSAENFDSLYTRKSIISAFKEAGFHTAFISNQRRNNSYIDFFGEEADVCCFIKDEYGDKLCDGKLLRFAAEEIAYGRRRQLIVLHTYGSHFNYTERYPSSRAVFEPDEAADADLRYKKELVNAYDNSIVYTDELLSNLIDLIEATDAEATMVFTSDHGEDLFDDDRQLFLHASPIPSFYQLYVPMLVWMSQEYREAYPNRVTIAERNRNKNVSSSKSFFHTALDLTGISTPYRRDEYSVVNGAYKEYPRLYLNDHNEAVSLSEIFDADDFDAMNRFMAGSIN